MALHLPIGPLKTRSGLELVPRCETSTYQPLCHRSTFNILSPVLKQVTSNYVSFKPVTTSSNYVICMYCLYVGFDYTYIDINALAQGTISFWLHKFGFKPLLGLEHMAPTRSQLPASYADHSAIYMCVCVCVCVCVCLCM